MKTRYALLGISLLINFSFGLNVQIPTTLKSNVSISINDSDTGNKIYSYNDTTPRLIASNVKLFTALFGLKYLGPNFHWHTTLLYSGEIRDHTLNGNIYIKGGGDPSLDTAAAYEIISNLNRLGINNVNGSIILDSSLFNNQPTYSMLQSNQYDADKILPSGLIINGNRAKFIVHINGNKITVSHNLYAINVINQLKLESASSACDMDDTVNLTYKNNTATLSGSVSPACDNVDTNFLILSNFENNKMVFSQVFADLGIKIGGKFINMATPKNAKLVYDHSSQNLAHIIYDMNKFSNNLYAETIISSVGAYKTSNTKTFSDGAKLYYTFLQTHKLLNTKFKLENGAGLSRNEYFTSKAVADLLYIADVSTLGALFEVSLPVAQQEGSLHNKFGDFYGRLMAKTGTLNDTRAYSGYFYNLNGHKYNVVFIANNLQNSQQKLAFLNLINQILHQLDLE